MSFWHRPLHAMTDAFTAAGFRISVISEPAPAPAARELFPDDIAAKPSASCASCSSSCTPTKPPRRRATTGAARRRAGKVVAVLAQQVARP